MLSAATAMRRHLLLSARGCEILVRDASALSEPWHDWSEDERERLLVVAPGLLRIGTLREGVVHCTFVLLRRAPDDAGDGWDQVNECGLELASGVLLLGDARFELPPGSYNARIACRGLASVDAELERGAESYELALWPAPCRAGYVRVRRQWI